MVLEVGTHTSRIIRNGQEEWDAVWVPNDKLKSDKLPRDDRRSYLSKLSGELVGGETAAFLVGAEILAKDPNFILTCSVTESLNPEFAEDYEARAGWVLPEHGEAVDGSKKCNVICSQETAEKLLFEGIHFEPFFGGPSYVGHGDRRGLWWGLVDLGFRIGSHDDQDLASIAARIAEKKHSL
jgi:hypothetical protein